MRRYLTIRDFLSMSIILVIRPLIEHLELKTLVLQLVKLPDLTGDRGQHFKNFRNFLKIIKKWQEIIHIITKCWPLETDEVEPNQNISHATLSPIDGAWETWGPILSGVILHSSLWPVQNHEPALYRDITHEQRVSISSPRQWNFLPFSRL